MQLNQQEWFKKMRQDWRYHVVTIVLCLVAFVVFWASLDRGWVYMMLGLIVAGLIYVPGGLYIEHLRVRKHEREKHTSLPR